MKYFFFITLLFSFTTFGRAPAVLPTYSTTPIEGGTPTEYIHIKDKKILMKSIAFKSTGQKIIKNKINITKKNPANFAPIFLMFFALSIPFLAWVFISDEEKTRVENKRVFISELEESEAEILEVNFGQSEKFDDKKDKEKLKKAS